MVASAGYAVGIDLGTSNTVALVRWPDGRSRPLLFDGQPVLPSGVYLDDGGTLHVGRDAQRMAQLDPSRYEPYPKRRIDEGALLLGDREVPIVDVLAAPLRAIARSVGEAVGHLPSAVLTYPAAWASTRRALLQDAAARAGWPPVRLMPEPIAAARYFTLVLGRTVPAGAVFAIFDFGGGTLDVALVRSDAGILTVVATGGAEDLGGLDIDAAIVGHLGALLSRQQPAAWAQISRPTDALARRHRRAFWEDVRAAKEMLSRSTVAPIAVPGVDASLHLTRDELEGLAAPLIRRAVAALTATLEENGLTPASLCDVFLVGGASRVPLVSRELHAALGIAPTVLDQPELPVAEGALADSAQAGTGASGRRSAVLDAVPAVAAPARPAPGPMFAAGPPTSVSGAPVPPISGPPVPGSPAPVGGGPVARMVPPRPREPMAPTPYHGGPWDGPPRPRRATRTWPILLAVLLVIGGLLGGIVYFVARPKPYFDQLEAQRRTTIPDLKPDGFRRSLLTATKGYAIGQRTDDTLEVVAVDLATGSEKRQRSADAAKWRSARAYGDWVMIESDAGADGKRALGFLNSVESKVYARSIDKNDMVVLDSSGPSGPDLEFFLISPAAGKISKVTVSVAGIKEGETHRLPAGARPITRGDVDYRILRLMDGSGTVYEYVGAAQPRPVADRIPAGYPTQLFAWVGQDLILAENKTEYQVKQGNLAERGPADRKPVWVGQCGEAKCVIDERGDDPSTRELMLVNFGSASDRVPVPYAAPGDIIEQSGLYFLVPTVNGGQHGFLAIHTSTHKSTSLAGSWLPIGAGMIVRVPAWSTAATAVELTGIKLGQSTTSKLGNPVIRSAGCSSGSGRLACPGENDFTVWTIPKR